VLAIIARRLAMERAEIVETTLGDLIVAIIDEASRHARDKQETYALAARILSDLLSNFRPEHQRSQ
jgi:hypothetical protein